PDGRVDYESVGEGDSIWITITKDGPLRGRRMLITKRPDGLFAVTGGAQHARDKGYFHAAMAFGKQRELTPEEQEAREKHRVKEEAKAKEREEFNKEHKGTL